MECAVVTHSGLKAQDGKLTVKNETGGAVNRVTIVVQR